jgi:hypothetical protein
MPIYCPNCGFPIFSREEERPNRGHLTLRLQSASDQVEILTELSDKIRALTDLDGTVPERVYLDREKYLQFLEKVQRLLGPFDVLNKNTILRFRGVQILPRVE